MENQVWSSQLHRRVSEGLPGTNQISPGNSVNTHNVALRYHLYLTTSEL